MPTTRSHKRPPASINRRVQYIGRGDPKRSADDPNAPLTDAQQRFVTAYLANGGNGTRAAFTAGYSRRSAASTASALLKRPKVEQAVREARLKSLEHLHSEGDDVLRELVAIAHMDPRDVVSWGPDGIELKNSGDIPGAAARAVSKVTQRISPGGTVTVEVSFHSKIEALKTLANHHGLIGGEPPDPRSHLWNVLAVALEGKTTKKLARMIGVDRIGSRPTAATIGPPQAIPGEVVDPQR